MKAFSWSLASGAALVATTIAEEAGRVPGFDARQTNGSYNFLNPAVTPTTVFDTSVEQVDPSAMAPRNVELTTERPAVHGSSHAQQPDLKALEDSDYDARSLLAKKALFRKVTRLGVRVQGDRPQWDEAHKRFVSPYYDTFRENYRAVFDTVNMASVEGALKYVQAECINASVVTSCERKNNVQYVVFFQTTTVQPPAALKYYANATNEYNYTIESCPFIPMDGGQCHLNTDGSVADICNQYIGTNDQPTLGFCVGGSLMDNDPMAPYPHNYWFSFPNSCPLEPWANKTDACRHEFRGGLCPLGKEPDGKTCTFTYAILGYILLDDVVGITSMVNPATHEPYANYSEFCEAGGIELSVSIAEGPVSPRAIPTLTRVESIPFWAKPGDRDANAERIEKLVSAYDKLVTTDPKTRDGGLMRKLPSVDTLTALNPPCYVNSPLCAASKFGCKRSYLAQICQLCTSQDVGCETL